MQRLMAVFTVQRVLAKQDPGKQFCIRMKKSIKLLFWIILLIPCLGGAETCPGSDNKAIDTGSGQQSIYWYEHGVKKRAWMALDEIAVFPKKGEDPRLIGDLLIQRFHPKAAITEKNNFLIYLKIPEPVERGMILEKLSSLRALAGVRETSPVFYASKKGHPAARFVLTGEIIVQFPADHPETKIATIEKEYGLTRLKSFSFAQNTILYGAGEPFHSLKVANHLYESGQVIYAYPNWLRSRAKRPDTLYTE